MKLVLFELHGSEKCVAVNPDKVASVREGEEEGRSYIRMIGDELSYEVLSSFMEAVASIEKARRRKQ